MRGSKRESSRHLIKSSDGLFGSSLNQAPSSEKTPFSRKVSRSADDAIYLCLAAFSSAFLAPSRLDGEVRRVNLAMFSRLPELTSKFVYFLLMRITISDWTILLPPTVVSFLQFHKGRRIRDYASSPSTNPLQHENSLIVNTWVTWVPPLYWLGRAEREVIDLEPADFLWIGPAKSQLHGVRSWNPVGSMKRASLDMEQVQ